jgi:hypothetical protein
MALENEDTSLDDAKCVLLMQLRAEEKLAWDRFAASALAGIMSQYSVNAHVHETVLRIAEFAADAADNLVEERRKRYGPK